MQFDDIEVKMGEIARATNDYNAYPKLFQMLWKRLTDTEHVMHVQKALILVEYLLRYGSERFIGDARRRSRDIAALQKYKHYDANNQDDAKEARAKAKVVNDLLSDEHRLHEERTKAAKLRENMRGIGSDDYGHNSYGGQSGGGGGGGYGGGGYGGGGQNAQPDYDNPYNNGGDRDYPPQQRQQQRREQPRDDRDDAEDPYAEAAPRRAAAAASAPAMSEEEQAAERKRLKKEKKKREAEAAAAAAAAGGADASADPDDPFSSSVIPASVGGAAAASSPASTGEPKKEKKEKKEKKKEKGESAASPAAGAPSAASQYAAMAAPPQAASSEVDLTSFVETHANSVRGQQGDGSFDFLSGAGAPGDDNLVDSFHRGASLQDQPTLWDQQQEAQQQQNVFDQAPTQQQGGANGQHQKKKDTWSSDLFNLERLDQAAPAHGPKRSNAFGEGGVSMSMMKGLNPNAAPTPTRNGAAQQQQQQQFMPPQQQQQGFGGNPAFAHTGGFAASNGFQQGPPLGPPQGYGYGQPNPYGQQQGYGMQQPQQMGGFGGPRPGGFGGPMMGGGGYPQQQMQQPGFGFPPQQQQQAAGGLNFHVPQQGQQARPQQQQSAMASIDPFASLSMQPSSRNSGGATDFFVPAARK